MIDKVSYQIPITFAVEDSPPFVHPWTISPRWEATDADDLTKGIWTFSIEPSFVNGMTPEIPTVAKFANQRTIDRLREEGSEINYTGDKPVVALLTERPRIPIPATLPRLIGDGADPTSAKVSPETGELSVEFESVPEFFEQFGIAKAPDITGGLNSGTITITDNTDPTISARRLVAADLVLYVDRLAFKIDTSNRGNPLTDGFTLLLSYSYGRSSPIKARPYMKLMSRFVPPAVGSASILDGAPDPEFDFIKVATIFFLSQEGASTGARIDGTWIPFVQHDIFWNLAHAAQRLVAPAVNEPLSVKTGLAAGLGDIINNTILSPLNDAYAEALLNMSGKTLEGSFWSV